MNMMTIDGFVAVLEIDIEQEIIRGKVVNVIDDVTFQARTVGELRNSFVETISIYRKESYDKIFDNQNLQNNEYKLIESEFSFLDEENKDSSDLIKSYVEDPSIQKYIDLRKFHASDMIDISLSPGYEWLFSNVDRLNEFGIDPNLVGAALDAKDDSTSILSLELLSKIAEREKLVLDGGSHLVSRKKVISDVLINFLICLMVEAKEVHGYGLLNKDLIVLIRHQLGGGVDIEWDRSDRLGKNRSQASWIAATLAAQGETPSYRSIAKVMGVNASSVMRWFPNDDLMTRARMMIDLSAQIRKCASDSKAKKPD